jgi:sialate O-acetylesterase
VADGAGKWSVRLNKMKAGGPYEMTVAGENTITLHNILVGEVWFCSGQSNMQWVVGDSNNADEEIAQANYPAIRSIEVPGVKAAEPQADFKGKWEGCTPQTAGSFTAVGYFLARELHKRLGVPVGIINCSWGGTPIQPWMSRASYPFELPAQIELEWGSPVSNYNAMVAPITPYAIAGAAWYQGESNADDAYNYRTYLPALIKGWRQAWGIRDLPFLIVQLANFGGNPAEPADSAWAELREAQVMALALPKTGMAVIIDIGDPADIHPRNKQEVGRRLALAAETIAYGEKLAYSGPMYDSMKIEDDKIRLRFRHTEGFLVAHGEKLTGFAIAGEDQKFVWAEAVIDGDTVVVSGLQVAKPVAVRYGWADSPVCNLFNGVGLPASPFRTDNWKGITEKDVPR